MREPINPFPFLPNNLANIAKALNKNTSNVLRKLQTLEEQGFVKRNEDKVWEAISVPNCFQLAPVLLDDRGIYINHHPNDYWIDFGKKNFQSMVAVVPKLNNEELLQKVQENIEEWVLMCHHLNEIKTRGLI